MDSMGSATGLASVDGVPHLPQQPGADVPIAQLPVRIRRSSRRQRTVQAHVADGSVVVQIPESLSAAEELEQVRRLVSRLAGAQARRVRGYDTDDALSARAGELSAAWRARPGPARSAGGDNQARRWGSGTRPRPAVESAGRGMVLNGGH